MNPKLTFFFLFTFVYSSCFSQGCFCVVQRNFKEKFFWTQYGMTYPSVHDTLSVVMYKMLKMHKRHQQACYYNYNGYSDKQRIETRIRQNTYSLAIKDSITCIIEGVAVHAVKMVKTYEFDVSAPERREYISLKSFEYTLLKFKSCPERVLTKEEISEALSLPDSKYIRKMVKRYNW